MPPSPSTRSRAPQIAAAAAVLVALVVAILLLLGGGDPSLREQYGGHGGTPNVTTGNTGRVALDGTWNVANDPQAAGTGKGFQAGRFEGTPVKLPFVPNANDRSVKSFDGSVAWYRTTLKVPETGEYALRFESANHKATVYLDGKEVAEHTGVYLPFEVKARLAKDETHTLVVRTDWRNPDRMKATGWHRAWFNFGGLNREVTIRPVTGKEVHGVRVFTTLEGGVAKVRIRASNATSGTLTRGESTTKLTFRDGTATATIAKPALWSPDAPNLYDLKLKAGERTSYTGRIGLRTISQDGSTMLLNGKPIKLRGASLHEDARGRGDGLTAKEETELVDELKDLGANATRAQHPLSPALMEKLDAAGILVWMGVGPVDAPGSWTSRGDKLVAQAKQRVRASLDQLQTHPSLFAWNLANEVAGQGHPAGQAPYIDSIAAELQEKDPSRLVALDIWGSHPPKYAGPMYRHIDAVGWTNYLGWYEQPYATKPELENLIRTKLTSFQDVFPDKVLVVTEFGAEGSSKNPAGDPGGYDFQANLLRTHIQTYARSEGVTGMLVWNLRDFAVAPSFGGGSITEVVDEITLTPGLNEKGLRLYDGKPKPAAAAVKQEYAKLR